MVFPLLRFSFVVRSLSTPQIVTLVRLTYWNWVIGPTWPTVTVMLQKMEKAGLIDRRTGSDGDTHRYALTDEGRAAFTSQYGSPS